MDFLEVIPKPEDYAIQAHSISRSAYSMPVLLRRLIYLVMAQVRPKDQGFMEITMTVGAIAKALEMGDHGVVYERIRACIVDGLKQVLEIQQPNGDWVAFQWLAKAEYVKAKDAITLRLHEELRPYTLEIQKAYASIAIADISRLQGRYSMRIFELVMSRKGQTIAGKWYYEAEIAELRRIFKIGSNEYQMTADFRKRVIEQPIKEINDAQIGLFVKPEYIRRGRNLIAIKFLCRSMARGDPKPVYPPTTEEEKEERKEEELIAKNPLRFAEILANVQEAENSQGELPEIAKYAPDMRALHFRDLALQRFRSELKLGRTKESAQSDKRQK